MDNMSVVDIIKHYQRSIEKCQGNEDRLLHCIGKLYRLPVTVQHLQDTGIGRTVNSLKKYEGNTGEAAKALVAKWKKMVAEEESSEGEEQEEYQQSPPEEVQPEQEVEHQRSRESSHHDKKHRHNSEERHRKSNSQDHVRKRRHEEESGRESEKRRKKQESESEEDSGSEDGFQVVDDDSGHDSDRSVSQASQEAEEESNEEEEPVPQKSKSSSRKDHSSSSREEHSRSRSKDKKRKEINNVNSKDHRSSSSSNKEHRSSKEHRSNKEYSSSSSKDHSSSSKDHSKINSSSRKEQSNNKEYASNDHSSHRKHKDKTKEKTENSHRKDEKRKDESSKKQKSSSSSSSHIPEKKSKASKEKQETEDGIDCSTGASFAEALGMVDPMVKKKPSTSSPGASSSSSRSKIGSPSKKKEVPIKSSPSSSSELGLLSPNVKLEPLHMEVDLDATLPPITPNYKPLPHYNFLDSPPHRKIKQLTEEEALSQVMSTKNQRTKVYSGVKSGKSWATVPSLFDICARVLQENIDALEYTGGVPYDLLKPVLLHANPDQLYTLEHYNPYLIEDTGDLWKFHCQKEFRNKQRQDMETWREMYLRCRDEREEKLKALTTNIQQSIAKSTPVRQTKLAYVDSVVKPPRNVARQQAKYGTAKMIKSPTPAAKAAARVSGAGGTPVRPPKPVHTPVLKTKPRMAPLMQKTMKLAKSFKR